MHCIKRQTRKEPFRKVWRTVFRTGTLTPSPMMFCHKALVFPVPYWGSFPLTPLRVVGVSAEGTLPRLTQTSTSPQIPTQLRSSCSSMVCSWLGFTFCYLLMQTKRWQKYWITSLIITQSLCFDHHLLSSGPVASFILKDGLRPGLFRTKKSTTTLVHSGHQLQ